MICQQTKLPTQIILIQQVNQQRSHSRFFNIGFELMTTTATATTTTADISNNMTTNSNLLSSAGSTDTMMIGENKGQCTYEAVSPSHTYPAYAPESVERDNTSRTSTVQMLPDAVESGAEGVASILPLILEDKDADTNTKYSASSPDVPFVSTQCLFCNMALPGLDANLAHMHKQHGLFLPTSIDGGTKTLAVDVETLLRYLHLVVFGYHECLLCHTVRQNPHAVQQHMMGRGHCRINLEEGYGAHEEAESEYRDFYEDVMGDKADETQENTEVEDEDTVTIRHAKPCTPSSGAVHLADDNTLRLSSGKTLSHRATPTPLRPNRRPLAQPPKGQHGHRGRPDLLLLENVMPNGATSPSVIGGMAGLSTEAGTDNSESASSCSASIPPSSDIQAQTQALTRSERRALAGHQSSAMSTALSQMPRHDRLALAHPSPGQQRAAVVRHFRVQEATGRAERRYKGKVSVRLDKSRHGLGMAWNIEVIKHDG